jgi:mannose-1-phosphate guanylyltransferase
VFKTNDFWRQIKAAGSSVAANALYLDYYGRELSRPLGIISTTDSGPIIIGHVYIHPAAVVHPTATIGPNVSIGPHVVIEEHVRIRESVILDRAVLKPHACVLYSVIGWDNKIGAWARVEGSEKNLGTANPTLTTNGIKSLGITILGEDVCVSDEVIIWNCVVLPHKELKSNYYNEILM